MSKDWKEVIRSLSIRPGWSQKAVAAYLGVSQPTVNEWLSGKRPIPVNYKIRLAGMSGWDKTALALEDLLPDDVAAAWADWNKRGTAELGAKLEKLAALKEEKDNSEKK